MRLTKPASLTGSAESHWELAQRVADSAKLRNCPKLRAFLLYVCENTLLRQTENVREQLIGSNVFGRPADYNISDDNIVRVEARELRKRLESYFTGEGSTEPVIIEIPKGGYVPTFRSREQAPAEVQNGTPELIVAMPSEPRARWRRWILPVWTAALVIASVWLIGFRLRSGSGSVESGDLAFYNDLLAPLGEGGGREILAILSNPKVVLYYGRETETTGMVGQGVTIPAPAELKKSFGEALNNIDRDRPYQYLHSTREDYTGMGEALSAFHLGRLLQAMHRQVRLTQGRFLTWDQVQKRNLIVLGSPMINDWTYRNIGNSNFNLSWEGVRNLKPLEGEQALYPTRRESGTEGGSALTDYGIVKMQTSQYGYNMLLIAGSTSSGTAGVGEFFTNPVKMKAVYDRIRAAVPGKAFPTTWEVLLKIEVRDGIPVDSSAIAWRPVAGAH